MVIMLNVKQQQTFKYLVKCLGKTHIAKNIKEKIVKRVITFDSNTRK